MRAQLPVHERHPAKESYKLIHTCCALRSVAADGAYAFDLHRGRIRVGACRVPVSGHHPARFAGCTEFDVSIACLRGSSMLLTMALIEV